MIKALSGLCGCVIDSAAALNGAWNHAYTILAHLTYPAHHAYQQQCGPKEKNRKLCRYANPSRAKEIRLSYMHLGELGATESSVITAGERNRPSALLGIEQWTRHRERQRYICDWHLADTLRAPAVAGHVC